MAGTNATTKARTKRNNTPAPAERYWTVSDFAAHFRLSRNTVYRLMDEGELGFLRFRRCRRIPDSERVRFEQERLVRATL